MYLLSAVSFIIISPTTVQFFLREYVCERVEGGWHQITLRADWYVRVTWAQERECSLSFMPIQPLPGVKIVERAKN